jgi:ubiquitin-conjugating enzyme E2 Z
MFEFSLKFPETYPDIPPVVQITTTNNGMTRFSPNLYSGGKVCLSILGTFSGPSWSSVMSLTTILHSILSIFGETPFTNEPGFEELKTKDYQTLSDKYTLKITHESIRISVLKRVEDLLKLSPDVSYYLVF